MGGGADSFNILTPGASGCALYRDYYEVRGRGAGIGLKRDEMLQIDGSSAGIKRCKKFGVNKLLSAYKKYLMKVKVYFLPIWGEFSFDVIYFSFGSVIIFRFAHNLFAAHV